MTSAQIAIMTTIILYLCLVIFTGVMIGLSLIHISEPTRP